MSALLMVLAGAVTAYVVIYYGVFSRSRCRSKATLQGKTAIVTGSNTGIGKATALDLAKRGARVILACRNKQKAEAAVFDIRRESGNTAVLFMPLDLASLKSVRTFAETFLKTEPRLDLLINNAGLMGPGRTEDGFGIAFGVNHLGHFLLTLLLLDRLKASGQSRIVNVSALLHRLGSVDFNTLNTHKDLVTGQSSWHCFKAYCHSKLCNVLFTRELANRLEGTGSPLSNGLFKWACIPVSDPNDMAASFHFWNLWPSCRALKTVFYNRHNLRFITVWCMVGFLLIIYTVCNIYCIIIY
uniref:Dehydrogenase/reductase (SDR family) member 13a, duplicate 3 n=1 Tax=Astyanax mexicanus TaxID=7994 RepID=A0A8B9KGF5_ASTMX